MSCGEEPSILCSCIQSCGEEPLPESMSTDAEAVVLISLLLDGVKLFAVVMFIPLESGLLARPGFLEVEEESRILH